MPTARPTPARTADGGGGALASCSRSCATARTRTRRSSRRAAPISRRGTCGGVRTWPRARRWPCPSLLGLGGAHQAPREADACAICATARAWRSCCWRAVTRPRPSRSSIGSSSPRAPVANDAWERAMGDPSVRWLRGRALEAVGRREEAEPLMADPSQVLSSYGPWWATRGRWARAPGGRGDRRRFVQRGRGGRPLRSGGRVRDPRAAIRADPPPAASRRRALVRRRAASGAVSPPFDAD